MYAIQYVKSKKQKMRQLSTPDVRPTYEMIKRKYGRANGQARQRPSSVETKQERQTPPQGAASATSRCMPCHGRTGRHLGHLPDTVEPRASLIPVALVPLLPVVDITLSLIVFIPEDPCSRSSC